MKIAEAQRAALAKELRAAGPNAATLCAGWDTHDLAAHLWIRENDPVSLPGIGIQAFEKLTNDRLARAKQRFSYDELVDRIESPKWWTKVASMANLAEFFIHRIDILRATSPSDSFALDRELESAIWGYLRVLGLRLRPKDTRVVYENKETGHVRAFHKGSKRLTIVGLPSEILLFLSGRGALAKVELIGPDDVCDEVRATNLGL